MADPKTKLEARILGTIVERCYAEETTYAIDIAHATTGIVLVMAHLDAVVKCLDILKRHGIINEARGQYGLTEFGASEIWPWG